MSAARSRIALLQLDVTWESPAENHERARHWLREAAAVHAHVAVLPEMFATGFSMNAERVAQPRGGETEQVLRRAATEHGLWIVAGVAERGEPRPTNSALVIGPSGELVRYEKIHPFSYAGEHEHYAAGDRLVTVDVAGLRVTPLVCYDLRFPEAFRAVADETDLFVVIASWPAARRHHWQTLLRARAIENVAYVAGVNRVGEGGGLTFAGDSALVAPSGEAIVSGSGAEAMLIADVSADEVRRARAAFPALGDRRPAAYRR